MNKDIIQEWLFLSDDFKRNMFNQIALRKKLTEEAVEKDWWVVQTLSLIFSMDCASALVFKGGTSLSKGWDLIERFSEDIDLALDKEYLGFNNETPNKKEVNVLRRLSYDFIVNTFTTELQAKFINIGLTNVKVEHQKVQNHDQDPLIVEIYYPKLTERETYLKPGLLVEIGSRSLKEPFSARTFQTFVSEGFPQQSFADKPITIPVVNPERTFLEKIFLLHEEFQRPAEKKRVERLSRHLYDIEKLMHTDFAKEAMHNKELYENIVQHRQLFAKLGGVDYSKHNPATIKFIPPDDLINLWEFDYKQMQENMIYGESLSFSQLIKNLTELQSKINAIQW